MNVFWSERKYLVRFVAAVILLTDREKKMMTLSFIHSTAKKTYLAKMHPLLAPLPKVASKRSSFYLIKNRRV